LLDPPLTPGQYGPMLAKKIQRIFPSRASHKLKGPQALFAMENLETLGRQRCVQPKKSNGKV